MEASALGTRFFAELDGAPFEILLIDEHTLSVNGERLEIDVRQGAKPEHFSLILDNHSHQVWIEAGESNQKNAGLLLHVHLHGFDFDVVVEDERIRRLRQFVAQESVEKNVGQVLAPMPGLVVKLLVEVGSPVQKGDGVIIVEAMKMENEIRSPLTGVVKEIRVSERQAVEKGEVLMVIA
ncbi:MAG: biotin/lipoyl-containing protein [bacterium]